MGNLSALRSASGNGIKKWNFFDPAIFMLLTEVGLNFFRFLKSMGMSGEQNLVVLSSRDNYSCSEHELRNVKVIINRKKLNLIKHLDLFLNTLVRVLPPGTSFVGYFSDEKHMNRSLIRLGILNYMVNLFGSGSNHIMNRDEVMELLEKNGFKTINMKEMNGLTYFVSQNVSIPALSGVNNL